LTTRTLAEAYVQKAEKRLKVLRLLLADDAYSDVVREAQELVELALKAMLRAVGVEPPKWHDVGPLLLDNAGRFPVEVGATLPDLAERSKALRKEREFAFYGDEDFIPTEEYDREDAEEAVRSAEAALGAARRVVRKG
jgi:hypothetical protein